MDLDLLIEATRGFHDQSLHIVVSGPARPIQSHWNDQDPFGLYPAQQTREELQRRKGINEMIMAPRGLLHPPRESLARAMNLNTFLYRWDA